MKGKRWAAIIGLALSLSAGPSLQTAMAQIGPGGGPIDIGADNLAVDDNTHIQTWTGNVEALQGTNRLRADKVLVYYGARAAAGGARAQGAAPNPVAGGIDKLEAIGNVYFVSPTQVVRGDKAVYTSADDTLVVTGEVVLKQGQNVLKGSRLVVNVGLGRATMDQGPGRVRGVFYPEQKQKPG